MEKDWMMLLQRESQVEKVLETNRTAAQYGLVLGREEAELIVKERANTLREERRIEFGASVTPKIIYEFCDSAYIEQGHYADTVIRLQEIFYLYKNEMLDEISDDELLHFMRQQFEDVCFGDLDYLEGTCLSIFAEAVRAGYRGYRATDGYGEYGQFDPVQRWDYELYLDALRELLWR